MWVRFPPWVPECDRVAQVDQSAAFRKLRPLVQFQPRSPGLRCVRGVRSPCFPVTEEIMGSNPIRTAMRSNSTGEQKLVFQASQVGSTPTGLTNFGSVAKTEKHRSLKPDTREFDSPRTHQHSGLAQWQSARLLPAIIGVRVPGPEPVRSAREAGASSRLMSGRPRSGP